MSGKIAVVTGAGSGIGRASALALLNNGYKVALAGRRKDALDETAKLAGNNTPNAHGRADRRHQARRHRGAVRQGQGDLGPARPGVQQCRRRRAAGAAGGAALRDLARRGGGQPHRPVPVHPGSHQDHEGPEPRGGRIINNGSISAHAPRPFSVAYTSTKHAITGLTKSTSLDGRAYDIACGQIDIGNAVTPMTERMTKGVLQPNGTTVAEPRMDVDGGGQRHRLHGQPAARRQRAVHDGDGDQDAVCWARLAHALTSGGRQRLHSAREPAPGRKHDDMDRV